MKNSVAKKVAISGVLAALATVIMCIGGFIPIATYVCPLLCMVLGCFVLGLCGKRHALIWYIAVSLLALLFGPDKEAAAVYVFLGNYPIIKSFLDKCSFSVLLKLIYFNVAITVLYSMLIFLFGLTDILADFTAAGVWGGIVLLVLGNITFILTDKVLGRFIVKR